MTSQRGFRAGLTSALIIGSLIGTAACTGDQHPSKAAGKTSRSATAGSSSPPAPSFPTTPRLTIRTSDEACDFDGPFKSGEVLAYLPNGPAYSGGGPHPAVLFKENSFGDDDEEEPRLPDKWLPTYFGRDTQLVVCQYRDDRFDGQDVGTCSYVGGSYNFGDGKVDVRSERYIYRVFEARTGKLVTKFTLNGTTSPEDSCPASTYVPTTYYQLVRSGDLAAKLRPFVEGKPHR